MDTLWLWLDNQVDVLRSSLWVVPAAGVLVGAVGAVLSAPLGDTGTGVLPLFTGSADSARGVLSVIAGSTMTVTSLTFSLTVVALQVASGQFTPRLMRSFLSDWGNKVVLAVFLGTFTLALLLLQSVQDGTDRFDMSVPTLGVSLAIVAALGSIVALVYFIHHLTQQLRIDRVMSRVADETLEAIEATHRPARIEDSDADEVDLPDDVVAVAAQSSGHLNGFDADAMLDAAVDGGCTVRLRPVVGAFVAAGTTLAWVWCDGGTPDDDDARALVVEHVRLARDRTVAYDPAFGIRQLVDIGMRALSPGINDPTTAVEAIQHLTRVLRRLATHDVGTLVRARDGSTVMFPRPSFADHLDMAVNQLLHYGASDAEVLRALAQLIRDVGEADEDCARVSVLEPHLAQLRGVVGDADLPDLARPAVEDALDVAAAVLEGRPAGAEPHAT